MRLLLMCLFKLGSVRVARRPRYRCCKNCFELGRGLTVDVYKCC